MKNITVIFTSVVICQFFFLACSTEPLAPVAPSGLNQWESRAQINDRENHKSHNVTVDFIALGQERLRINVTGAFATPVAVAVLDHDQLTYLLPRQKKFYQGAATKRALQNLTGMALEREQIFNILYNQSSQGPGWKCQPAQSPQGAASAERRRTDGSPEDRAATWRSCAITGPRYDVQMQVERVPTKVRGDTKALGTAEPFRNVFSLNIPSGYQNVLN